MFLLQTGFSEQQLKNITKNIFGSDDHVEMLPVAFGDFNSDKLTLKWRKGLPCISIQAGESPAT